MTEKSGENISEIIEDLNNDRKNEIFNLKTQNKESIDKKIYTRFTKEKSGKNNPEISEIIEDLDDDELKIYNCLKNDFSGEAETGDIAMKLRMGSFLVGNRFNRLKSKGLVTEIRKDEGGINWRIVP